MAFTKIQLRRDTVENWVTSNPTPTQGELCLDTDRNAVKIGNGSQAWSELPYFTGVEVLSLTCYQEISASTDIYMTVETNTLGLTNITSERLDTGRYILYYTGVSDYYTTIGLIQMGDREAVGNGYGKFLDIQAYTSSAYFNCCNASVAVDIDSYFQIVIFFIPRSDSGMLD